VSGEFSHAHLQTAERLAREMQDGRTVFDKINLILRNWYRVSAADPKPTYDSQTEKFCKSTIPPTINGDRRGTGPCG